MGIMSVHVKGDFDYEGLGPLAGDSKDGNGKGLENLLSEFSRTMKDRPILLPSTYLDNSRLIPCFVNPKESSKIKEYYDYVYQTLNVSYTLSDVELFAKQDINMNFQGKATRLGLFISAAITKS